MAAAEISPALEMLVRDHEGYSILAGPPFDDGQPTTKTPKVPCTSATFNEDGSRLMVIKPDGIISIFDCKTYKEIRSIQLPDLVSANISPHGTYLQTFQKQSTPQEKNVNIWDVETGRAVYNFSQKNMSKTTWPSIRFSSDELVASRLATNEIQFFDPADFSKGIVSRLRIPGVAAAQVSRLPGSHIATFIPESKGVPASVQIFACGSDTVGQPLARRSFFRCSTVQLHWNNGSTGLLAVAQADVDKTNQSYYGESKLSYLTTDGSHEGLVPLRKDGPIHDVQWSHTGSEFAVVYGFMPAKATVFDKKCNPLLDLGTGPYNTIRWNPKGRFLCLAGFGNLPGDMVFNAEASSPNVENETNGKRKTTEGGKNKESPNNSMLNDRLQKFARVDLDDNANTCILERDPGLCKQISEYHPSARDKAFWDCTEKKQLGTTKAEWSVISEWSPNGCYFMTASTAPRRQVDNGIKIFHHNGSLYYKQMFDKLFQAEWKPESADRFGDIAELVKSVGSLKIEESKSPGQGSKASQSATKVNSANAPTKPAAYRPPHAKQAAAARAELLGGMETQEMSKNALKNKKKREKQREKKAAEAAAGGSNS